MTVWRSTEGELESEILTTSNAEPTTSSLVALSLHDTGGGATAYEFDNVRILADDLDTETTFTVNDADELISSATTYGGTTYFEYDAWGRMTRKYMGSSGSPTFEATYDYKYDDKLVAVNSDFPDEGDVSYTYGADGQRRSRTAGGVTTTYNWSGDYLISLTDQSGAIVKRPFGVTAEISSSGDYRYRIDDHNYTLRLAVDENGIIIGDFEHSPFGQSVKANSVGDAFFYRYAARQHDTRAQLDLTGSREYHPELCRWGSREPTGSDGLLWYSYASNTPVVCRDSNGLIIDTAWDIGVVGIDLICGNYGAALFDGAMIFVPFVPAGMSRVKRLMPYMKKAPKLDQPNTLVRRIYADGKQIVAYPTITFYDAAGRQRFRTDYFDHHGMLPHTHSFPKGGPKSGVVKEGTMRDIFCL